jgi:hypothetical protein
MTGRRWTGGGGEVALPNSAYRVRRPSPFAVVTDRWIVVGEGKQFSSVM